MILEFRFMISFPSKKGMIDENDRQWIAAPELNIEGQNVSKNTDYVTMSYENRAIDLDRLDAPPGNTFWLIVQSRFLFDLPNHLIGHVVTGLRLRSLGGHLNLEIQVNLNTSYKILLYIL